MAFSYFIHTRHLDERVTRASIVSLDWTPTLHHYGRLETREEFANPEAFGLVLADDETEDAEAEAGALYRAEMRHTA